MEAEAKPKPTLQPLATNQVLHVTSTDQLPPNASSAIDPHPHPPLFHPPPQQNNNDSIKDENIYEEDEGEDDDDDAYLDSFPPGFRFCPRDEELILHYLNKKVMNEPLPRNRIMEVNLYLHNPENLAERFKQYGEKEWYFFTPRDKKYKNGTRPNRAAGDGYWKATGADKSIYYNKRVVGSRKALVFYKGKPPKGDKTNWIMHEYRVVDSPRSRKDMRLDDWVLCRIYKKLEKSNNKMLRAKERSPSPPPEDTHENSNEQINFDDEMSFMHPCYYDSAFPTQDYSTYADDEWDVTNLDFASHIDFHGVSCADSLISLENIHSDVPSKPFKKVSSTTNSK